MASPLSPAELAALREFACELADTARGVILPYWRRPIVVESKIEQRGTESESPVTEADRAAELAMRQQIEGRFPAHGIYGEEFGSVRTDATMVWVLDPIDGTKSFITGKPLFGTLIACLHDGMPVLGVIDQCVLDERWVGVQGLQTTLNGKPVHTRASASLGEVMMYATTPHMFSPGLEQERYAAMCDAVKRPLYGADCYAYALVASGFGADLVVEADLGLYDYCALVPVVEGAGGVMSDWQGRRLTLDNHEESKGRVVAAANEALHREALEILAERPSAGAGGGAGVALTAALAVALGLAALELGWRGLSSRHR
jgi:inositol-phosphate phosphatase/L-galactose 1-phosphate phosphatase/histidinol-phosphatase